SSFLFLWVVVISPQFGTVLDPGSRDATEESRTAEATGVDSTAALTQNREPGQESQHGTIGSGRKAGVRRDRTRQLELVHSASESALHQTRVSPAKQASGGAAKGRFAAHPPTLRSPVGGRDPGDEALAGAGLSR